MLSPPWKYFICVVKEWANDLTGRFIAGTGVISIIGVALIPDAKAKQWATDIAVATSIALVGFVFSAQYKVWKQEYDRVANLESSRVKADLRGSVYGFHDWAAANKEEALQAAGETSILTRYKLRLDIVNHGEVSTNIRDVILDGSDLPVRVRLTDTRLFFSARFAGQTLGLSSLPELTLEPGIAKNIELITTARFDGYNANDEFEIPLEGLKVTVLDGFGERHLIKVRDGELLTWQQKAKET